MFFFAFSFFLFLNLIIVNVEVFNMVRMPHLTYNQLSIFHIFRRRFP